MVANGVRGPDENKKVIRVSKACRVSSVVEQRFANSVSALPPNSVACYLGNVFGRFWQAGRVAIPSRTAPFYLVG